MKLLDPTRCTLGEGPLWHPKRKALFWFDILGNRMYCHEAAATRSWPFDEPHSAAGWVDNNTLLIASQTGLWRFDITTGDRTLVTPLEADTPVTRSNDGRADPWGGFWIGSMGHQSEPKAGAIHRYYRGTLRRLVPDVTISNAICFAPDRACAYYTDTATQQIMRQPLDPDTGWPANAATPFIDLRPQRQNPDGAVTDAKGNLWVALWGASRVSGYSPQGTHLRDIDLPAKQPTCPAFGGPDLTDLIVTSAALGQDGASDGQTFVVENVAKGLPEPRVIL